MTSHATMTALVTGASSGVGWEAAAQLAEAGYGRIIITARTAVQAAAALTTLRERAAGARFDSLTLDLDDFESVSRAAETLIADGTVIDALILNAGVASTTALRRTSVGIEQIMAATLTGHHAFTLHLLRAGLLSAHARIIIAGSEAARGDVPSFTVIDVVKLAAASFDGDLERAIEAVLRADSAVKYTNNTQYATAKTFAIWWAKELASQLPAGMTVNAVSPGNTPDTRASRGMPAVMRAVVMPLMKLVPGVSHSVPVAAARYLSALEMSDDVSGKFFASPSKKMTGPLTEATQASFLNPEGQRALWRVLEKLANK